MTFDPTSLDLAALFTNSAMFDSRRAWRRTGFSVLDPAKDTECMVAVHPSAPGYLFKKYTDDVSSREQRWNYEARIKGAEKLTTLISKESLHHVVVPRKYLYKLPRPFGKDARILVVERLNLLGKDESAHQYHDITEPVLYDLLRVLVRFPGLDSNSKNVQFTRNGQIAFVDLENWNRPDRKEVKLKSIGSYLSKEKLQLARRILEELE